MEWKGLLGVSQKPNPRKARKTGCLWKPCSCEKARSKQNRKRVTVGRVNRIGFKLFRRQQAGVKRFPGALEERKRKALRRKRERKQGPWMDSQSKRAWAFIERINSGGAKMNCRATIGARFAWFEFQISFPWASLMADSVRANSLRAVSESRQKACECLVCEWSPRNEPTAIEGVVYGSELHSPSEELRILPKDACKDKILPFLAYDLSWLLINQSLSVSV